jgi:hypothetical protein
LGAGVKERVDGVAKERLRQKGQSYRSDCYAAGAEALATALAMEPPPNPASPGTHRGQVASDGALVAVAPESVPAGRGLQAAASACASAGRPLACAGENAGVGAFSPSDTEEP